MWKVRGRATFAALASGRRFRRGPVTLSSVTVSRHGGPATPPRVAYGVSRKVGGAVTRNRLRRRLRAAVTANRDALVGGDAYLVGGDRRALELTATELADAIGAMLDEAVGTPGRTNGDSEDEEQSR